MQKQNPEKETEQQDIACHLNNPSGKENTDAAHTDQTDDDELKRVLNESLSSGIVRCIVSNPRIKDGPEKIAVRPVLLGGVKKYQVTEYIGAQVFHHNYSDKETAVYLENRIRNSFKQCELLTGDKKINMLVSKRGKITIKQKISDIQKIVPAGMKENLLHNREKKYLLREGVPVPFLQDLGVMTKDGKVVSKMYDKFRQINRFLEYVRDIQDELPKDREITVIDFGCGKSYLTFAVYYYLHELCGREVRITGLDLKKEVIEHCNRLSERYGYDRLVFKRGDIADFTGCESVDMVITLHACDTATDYALYKAVTWNASVILSVPCCQHELNRQIGNELLQPVLSYGILKDRFAAILTDAIRAEVLKNWGYDVGILEFIDMEHTPKNLLIRAVKTGKRKPAGELKKMIGEFHVAPKIVELLPVDSEIKGEKSEEYYL